jgi:RNA polymerase sigma-70 factor (ECF subfamily)
MADDPDAELVTRARGGDEAAFTELVRRHSPSLLRVARSYVPSTAIAEEVVQETWLGVLRGLERFEGRSSFRTWLFTILVNRARTRGVRESRSVPVDEVAVDDHRFSDVGDWAAPPRRWDTEPETALESAEARRIVEEAVAGLPERQRAVITLRDLEGLSSEDVRNALDLSETNQRVLLHRARTKVRQALEDWIAS